MEPAALAVAKNRVMEKLTRDQARRTVIELMTKDDENYYLGKVRNVLMSYYYSMIINSKGPKFYMKILGE